jgi:murein DD-endopeptidase MepM/ murein hydrolase activator NlpD
VDAYAAPFNLHATRSPGSACLHRAELPRRILKSLGSWNDALASAAAQGSRLVSEHPRSLTAAVMLALAGFGVTAFGIAPMAPDASDLPKRLVTESVKTEDVQKQLDALAEYELELYRTDLTRASDTADSLLSRLNVSDADAANFLRTDALARKVLEGRGGKMIRVQTGENGSLTELVARFAVTGAQAATHFNRLRIAKVGGKFEAQIEIAPLAPQVRMGSGTVRTSLFAATDDARIPDAIATQLADAFSTDIDFHRELHKGDIFSVVYEAMTADGEPITWNGGNGATGRLLAADFINGDKTYSAVWYQDAQGKGGYYGFDGLSKRRAFLATPVAFSRITSGFAMRMHPILNTWKQHKGVDYGAPTGTPVRAVGDGEVDYAGWQNGYGNMVEIRHSNNRSTLYAHLSRIDVRRGQHIDQGEQLGAVGMTGWATGPHLHFEVKMKGVQQDPMQLAKSSEAIVLSAAQKGQFMQMARSLKGQLEVAEGLARASDVAE